MAAIVRDESEIAMLACVVSLPTSSGPMEERLCQVISLRIEADQREKDALRDACVVPSAISPFGFFSPPSRYILSLPPFLSVG